MDSIDSKIHTGNEIRKRLNEMKRSITWLADELDCCNTGLGRQLNKRHIHSKLLYRISMILDKDFFEIYSKALAEAKKEQK